MQTVDERPFDAEAEGKVVQTKPQPIEPIQYVPFEDSFWLRNRGWIWSLIILFCLGVGAFAILLVGFVPMC